MIADSAFWKFKTCCVLVVFCLLFLITNIVLVASTYSYGKEHPQTTTEWPAQTCNRSLVSRAGTNSDATSTGTSGARTRTTVLPSKVTQNAEQLESKLYFTGSETVPRDYWELEDGEIETPHRGRQRREDLKVRVKQAWLDMQRVFVKPQLASLDKDQLTFVSGLLIKGGGFYYASNFVGYHHFVCPELLNVIHTLPGILTAQRERDSQIRVVNHYYCKNPGKEIPKDLTLRLMVL